MLEILVLEEGVAFESSDTIHSQGEQHTVVIAYPFQASLDCLHCGEKFDGMDLEDYVKISLYAVSFRFHTRCIFLLYTRPILGSH